MGVDGASESRGLCDAGWNSNHSSWLQVPSLSLQQQWQLAPIPRSLRLSSGLTPPSQHVLLTAFSQLGRRQPLITAWWRQCLHSAPPAFQHGVNSPCGARSVCSTHCGVLLLPHPGGHAPCTSVLGYLHLPWWASDAIGQGHVCPLIFASPCLAQSRAHETSAQTHGLCVVSPPSFLTG